MLRTYNFKSRLKTDRIGSNIKATTGPVDTCVGSHAGFHLIWFAQPNDEFGIRTGMSRDNRKVVQLHAADTRIPCIGVTDHCETKQNTKVWQKI